jgi:hypothetical protein
MPTSADRSAELAAQASEGMPPIPLFAFADRGWHVLVFVNMLNLSWHD